VQSFYAPYLCDSCGTRFQAVIDAHVHRGAIKSRRAPQVVCPNCGHDSRYDGPPTAFATAAEQLEKAATLVTAEKSGEPPLGAPENLERRVANGVTRLVLHGELAANVRWRSGMDGIEGPLVLDLTQISGTGAGAIAPLITMIRSLPPELSSFTIEGSPLVLAQTLRGTPAERVTVASVLIEGHCNKCKTLRRAAVPVKDGKWEDGVARGVTCPKDGTRLEMNRTLQDVPQKRMPIVAMVFGSSGLAVLGVLVVLAAAWIAMWGVGPGAAETVDPDQATLGPDQVVVRGRGGPYGTELDARRAARSDAMAQLISELYREIGARRGESVGAFEANQTQVDQFVDTLGPDDVPIDLESKVEEGNGGFSVQASYALPRARFDAIAQRYADERAWGGLVLRRPFPPAPGLLVSKSDLQGVDSGVRVVKLGGAAIDSFDQLPPSPSGSLVTVAERDGSQREIIVP
jgi:DNA-directed RNA polymerase subunit RPC12/RpoP